MTEWVTIAIPKPIADDIHNIIGLLGYPSLTAFCHEAIRNHLEKKKWEYERKMAEKEDAIVKKHEEGEESVEHQWSEKP